MEKSLKVMQQENTKKTRWFFFQKSLFLIASDQSSFFFSLYCANKKRMISIQNSYYLICYNKEYSCLIISAAFSAIAIVVLIVLTVTTWGMMDASTTLTPSTPLSLEKMSVIIIF